MPPFKISPTGGALGAEVHHLDLSRPLAPRTAIALRAAFLQYGLLLFRGQTLSRRDQVRFSRHFGDPVPHPTNLRDRDPEAPEICIISNAEEQGRPLGALGSGEVHFHADLVFLHEPGSASVLYCLEAPERGGDTYWTNNTAAYQALDQAQKERIADLETLYVHRRAEYNPPVPAAHPLVCTHPESGRKTLFISPSSAREIVGLDQAAGRRLLEALYDHITQDRFVWRHQWRPGDLVVWDNRCTMHRRDAFDPHQRRYMRRTQILGPPSAQA